MAPAARTTRTRTARSVHPVSALLAGAMVALTALSGCGFRPMYGERAGEASSSPVSADLASIRVDTIPDRPGQMLRNHLNFMLNPNSESAPRRYTLAVQLRETVNSFAVQRSGFASRADIELLAFYQLVDDASGSSVFDSTSRSVSGYNILDNDFSTVTATNDARARNVERLAYEIRNRLSGYFAGAPAKAPAAAPPMAEEAMPAGSTGPTPPASTVVAPGVAPAEPASRPNDTSEPSMELLGPS